MENSTKALIGVGASAVVAGAWELYPNKQAYRLAITKSPLAFVEHYHWGLASIIVARYTKKYQYYLDGLGVGLIASEAVHPQPFGIIGKTVPELIGNLCLTTVLGVILYGSLK